MLVKEQHCQRQYIIDDLIIVFSSCVSLVCRGLSSPCPRCQYNRLNAVMRKTDSVERQFVSHSIRQSFCLTCCLSTFVYLVAHLPACLCLTVCLPAYLSVCSTAYVQTDKRTDDPSPDIHLSIIQSTLDQSTDSFRLN